MPSKVRGKVRVNVYLPEPLWQEYLRACRARQLSASVDMTRQLMLRLARWEQERSSADTHDAPVDDATTRAPRAPALPHEATALPEPLLHRMHKCEQPHAQGPEVPAPRFEVALRNGDRPGAGRCPDPDGPFASRQRGVGGPRIPEGDEKYTRWGFNIGIPQGRSAPRIVTHALSILASGVTVGGAIAVNSILKFFSLA